jgi:two-component system, sporulation sensor kinase E
LEKLIDRLDKLDAGSVQTQFLRLAGEKGLLETIFHAIQEGLIVLDGKGRISYANRAAENMLGFNLATAQGTAIARYIPDIEWSQILKLDEQEWSRLISREIEINYPKHRFVDFYVVPLAAVNEKERGAVMILRDITRERHKESINIESERLNAITLLAAGVAHEIGNPLNSLTIHLQLLNRELKHLAENDRAPMQELVEVAQREVERLDQIITQFLRALRPSQPQLEARQLGDVLNETLSFLRQEIKDRDVLAEVEAAEDLPTTRIDANQMKQAFFNIIRNAIQVMPNGGLLKITLGFNDRFVFISFKDTGPGIPAGDLGTIFEPYFTTKSEGSGLGLMIVQRIVRDHGGELEIHSEPDAGTTFTIYLPREEARIRLLKAPKSEAEHAEVAS